MSVKQKYLKDENGEVFSPIVSTDSIITGGGSLSEILDNHYEIFSRKSIEFSANVPNGRNYNHYYTIKNTSGKKRFGLLTGYIMWSANNTGNRGFALSDVATEITASQQLACNASQTTRQNICYPLNFQPNEEIYISMWQDCGSTLGCTVKIKILYFDKIDK